MRIGVEELRSLEASWPSGAAAAATSRCGRADGDGRASVRGGRATWWCPASGDRLRVVVSDGESDIDDDDRDVVETSTAWSTSGRSSCRRMLEVDRSDTGAAWGARPRTAIWRIATIWRTTRSGDLGLS